MSISEELLSKLHPSTNLCENMTKLEEEVISEVVNAFISQLKKQLSMLIGVTQLAVTTDVQTANDDIIRPFKLTLEARKYVFGEFTLHTDASGKMGVTTKAGCFSMKGPINDSLFSKLDRFMNDSSKIMARREKMSQTG